MGTSNYSDEFKRDAVHQITVRGYPVREVSRQQLLRSLPVLSGLPEKLRIRPMVRSRSQISKSTKSVPAMLIGWRMT